MCRCDEICGDVLRYAGKCDVTWATSRIPVIWKGTTAAEGGRSSAGHAAYPMHTQTNRTCEVALDLVGLRT